MNLAEELRRRGSLITFITRNHPGNGLKLLQERLFRYVTLPDSGNSLEFGLLGVSQDDDLRQTIAALNGDVPDWIIVDHYGIDIAWEKKIRRFARKIMVIDDFVDRQHDCDLYLNQNYLDYVKSPVTGVVTAECQLLLGPRFALLDKKFHSLRLHREKSRCEQKQVLVFCGGSDPEDLTGKVVQALHSQEFEKLQVNIVVGTNYRFLETKNFQNLSNNFTVHKFGRKFLDLLSQADYSIGAGGVTGLERMCLGIPSIVVSIASNQEQSCIELGKRRVISYLGRSAEVDAAEIRNALKKVLLDDSSNEYQRELGQIMVDGRGSMRVAECLVPSSVEELEIRLAFEEDIFDYFIWANEPEVRKQALGQIEIEWNDHKKWFGEKLTSPMSHLFVLEVRGLPVGQVRLDKVADSTEIGYSIDAGVRQRGWATLMVGKVLILGREAGVKVFKAVVRDENLASQRVFEKLGFMKESSTETQLVVYVLKVMKLPSDLDS